MKSIIKEADRCLFERLLGSRWNELSKPVRALHDPDAQVQRRGSFTICHGTHRLARLIVRLMRLPREGTDVPGELGTVTYFTTLPVRSKRLELGFPRAGAFCSCSECSAMQPGED